MTIQMLLDTILNSKAVALQLKITRRDDRYFNNDGLFTLKK
jgi:hypothetical protein